MHMSIFPTRMSWFQTNYLVYSILLIILVFLINFFIGIFAIRDINTPTQLAYHLKQTRWRNICLNSKNLTSSKQHKTPLTRLQLKNERSQATFRAIYMSLWLTWCIYRNVFDTCDPPCVQNATLLRSDDSSMSIQLPIIAQTDSYFFSLRFQSAFFTSYPFIYPTRKLRQLGHRIRRAGSDSFR